ncbi:MAG: DUF3467 domain-containing protein [Aquificaceae bacterium]|nr:DUF3467 domain-containing protein [Aquificaceae bacterium]MCX8060827.1 DUF3467 domain-containing protein [Aquificaceae bacterium]MDW8096506.1 DUF3467 domain-containing protein [Aquificaceae bacterium]
MKLPHHEFIRYESWKEQFLRDYPLIATKEAQELEDLQAEGRLLRAILSMHVGGHERRLEDPDVRHWANWAGLKTYRTFNAFPQLSEVELCFVFYALGKLFVPLLLHERGVRSEPFKRLSPQEQEQAVMQELEVIWENHLIRILQIIPFLDLSRSR